MTTKIVSYGGTVVLADQWFQSSKTCHYCGRINQELKLKDRTGELSSLWNENRPRLECCTVVISVWGN
ncbi:MULTISPECIES: zinc ribbon domain-containing protein [Okeania]|uniref:zinc ribbon domain-containing protein n=1 Tax=Okeania TaxID=1458928 RepID=UPI001374B735|nr:MULTISPECIES: zinc ribbon domain-containing protein [Okeania]NET14704.1 transposase [Okeania sp. SIO1H6]NET17887.1 transposase [Okeania sp. SIO1H5]NES75464.1 transposase [Okeania sp. SIO1H4]NES91600.1 transposase [Okeania sp. SIO2B9]NET77292.1 transposase [Okeania sp. SIO1F9]